MAVFSSARGALIGLLLPLCASAQAPDSGLPLDSLLRVAVADNPALAVARLHADALGTRAEQVSARPNPTVGVTAFPAPILTARGAQQAQVRVEQRFPWPGTLRLRAEAAALRAEAAEARSEVYALDVALAVKTAYVDLAHVQATRRHVEAFQLRLAAFAEAAMERYEVGRGPQSAILQIQLARKRLTARLLQLDAEASRAFQRLARLLDRPSLTAFNTVPLASLRTRAVGGVAVDSVLAQRPENDALEARVAQAEAEATLVRKARYPDLGVNVTYFNISDRAVPASADGRDAFALGVTMRIPLDRIRQRAQAEEARLRMAEAEAERAALATEITTTLADLRAQLRNEAAQIALHTDRLLPQADAIVTSVLAAYATGQADHLALLDAERTRLDLRLALDAARARYARALAALERTLGTPPTRTELGALNDE
ncbi:MAG: TolC family protein [Bacteroidota bacterium]